MSNSLGKFVISCTVSGIHAPLTGYVCYIMYSEWHSCPTHWVCLLYNVQ